MAFTSDSNGKFYYQVLGEGIPVVLLKGLGCNSEHWNGWEADLAKFYKVVLIDNRGMGRTKQTIRPWDSMATLAADVASVLNTERIDKAHIVGVSLGGMISIQFALDFPDKTITATAINSSIGESGHLRLSVEALKLLSSTAFDKRGMYQELARLLTAPTSSEETRQLISRDWKKVDSKYPQSGLQVLLQILIASRWNNWSALSQIKSPLHLIYGEDDQFVPKGNTLFIASKCSTAVTTGFENCGHEPHIDQPEKLLKALSQFFENSSLKNLS